MHSLIQRLLQHAPVVTDGAWGTEMQKRGLASGECPDAWNLTHPDQVADVARSYVTAGSRIILTNTFGANRLRLKDHNLADQLVQINRRGVEISRRAAKDRACVFASMGPTGKMLLSGETDLDELRATFGEQARVLAEAGADALVVETMADLDEAVAAVAAGVETGLPVVACMVFDSGKDKDRTMMGITPEQAASALTAAGADVIGANCGLGVAGYLSICRRLHLGTERPIWIKANAGLPELVDRQIVYRTTPQTFASYAKPMVEAGAAFIGGCCGTTPAFIRALCLELGCANAAGGSPRACF
jgi:methionine synthase I (cobalamin-dependent)